MKKELIKWPILGIRFQEGYPYYMDIAVPVVDGLLLVPIGQMCNLMLTQAFSSMGAMGVLEDETL